MKSFGFSPFPSSRRVLGVLVLASCWLLTLALAATELRCEKGDNEENGCCCFQKAHSYSFSPVEVSRMQITFDTGSGVGCASQVSIQVKYGPAATGGRSAGSTPPRRRGVPK